MQSGWLGTFGGSEESKKAGWVEGHANRGHLTGWKLFDVSHLLALSGCEHTGGRNPVPIGGVLELKKNEMRASPARSQEKAAHLFGRSDEPRQISTPGVGCSCLTTPISTKESAICRYPATRVFLYVVSKRESRGIRSRIQQLLGWLDSPFQAIFAANYPLPSWYARRKVLPKPCLDFPDKFCFGLELQSLGLRNLFHSPSAHHFLR